MQPRAFFLFAFAFLAILLGRPAASAQNAVWVATYPVTVALTFTYSAPGMAAKDETGKVIPAAEGGGMTYANYLSYETRDRKGDVVKSVQGSEMSFKPVTVRVGNAQIIKALLDANKLPTIGDPTNEPSVAGWSLVYQGGYDGSGAFGVLHGPSKTLVVPLEGIGFGFGDPNQYAMVDTNTLKDLTVINYNPAKGTATGTTTFTGSFSRRAPGAGQFFFDGHSVPVMGVYSETGTTHVVKTETVAGQKYYTVFRLLGPRKLDKIVGSVVLHLNLSVGDPMALIEGTISCGAGTIVDDLKVFNHHP